MRNFHRNLRNLYYGGINYCPLKNPSKKCNVLTMLQASLGRAPTEVLQRKLLVLDVNSLLAHIKYEPESQKIIQNSSSRIIGNNSGEN